MTSALSTAQQIAPAATEKEDAVFGRMILCGDAETGQAVARHLAAAGHHVLWSHRISPDRVFLDRPETAIVTG